jgi:hypothetical protein
MRCPAERECHLAGRNMSCKMKLGDKETDDLVNMAEMKVFR